MATMTINYSSNTTITSKDGCSVTKLVVVDQLQTFFVRLHSNDSQNRSEDFIVVTLHAGLGVVDQAWLQEEAFGRCTIATVNNYFRSFTSSASDIACDLVAMFASD